MTETSGQRKSSRIPRDIRRLMVQGGLWSLVFQTASKVSVLGTTLLAAHQMSVSTFGLFAAFQGITVVLGAVTDFGSSTYIERETAARRLSPSLVCGAVRLRLMILVGVASGVVIVCIETNLHASTVVVFATAGLAFNASLLTNALLLGQLRFRASAIPQGAGRLVFLGVMLALWAFSSTTLLTASVAFLIGELTILVGQGLLLKRTPPVYDELVVQYSMKSALPYWLNSIFNLTYNRADAAIVAALAGGAQAGLYAPASAMQSALMSAPGLVTAALPYVGARAYADYGPATVLTIVKRTGILAGATGLVTAVVGSAFAAVALSSLLGSKYDGSVLPTIILVWSLPFYGVGLALSGYLIAVGRPALTMWGYGAALVTSLAGNLLLTPAHGAVGGSVASLAREPVAVIALLVAVGWTLRTTTSEAPGGAPGPAKGRGASL